MVLHRARFAVFASVLAGATFSLGGVAFAEGPFDLLRPTFDADTSRALEHFRARRYQEALGLAGRGAGDASRLLVARALLAMRRFGEAAPTLEKLAASTPLLAEHFLARAARAFLNAGDAAHAYELAARVTADTPVLPEATLVAADAAFVLGRFDEARTRARAFYEKWPKNPGSAPALWIEARAAARLGKRADTKKAERRIVAEFPDSPLAAKLGDVPLSAEEAIARAEKLVSLHRNDRATPELQRALGRTLTRAQRCKATYLLGAANQRRRKHKAAFAAFAKAARVCGDDKLAARTLYLWGKGLLNGRSTAGAARILEKLAARFPKHRLADDALFLAAQGWRRAGQLGRARAALEKLLAEMPEGDMRPRAAYELARLDARDRNWNAAATRLQKMADEDPYPADSYLRGRPLYALGKLMLARKDRTGAARAWRRCLVEHPHTYWAALARGRLLSLGEAAGDDPGAAFAPTPDALTWPALPDALSQSAAFQRAAALIRLGAGDFAAAEVSLAAKHAGETDEARAWLSLLYYFAGDWHRAHRIVRYKLKHVLARPPTDATRRFFLLGYPRGFWDVLEPLARRHRVDPLLLVALVREESAFNPVIESWANAVGLGQLIWPTARRMAQVLRIRGFHRGMLIDPSVNLQLAAKYLSNLLRRFKGAAPLAVAAYNAGELAVERWLRERGAMPIDAFVDAIPYEQTRLYTRRVMRSYATYRLLYGEGAARYLSLGPRHARQATASDAAPE